MDLAQMMDSGQFSCFSHVFRVVTVSHLARVQSIFSKGFVEPFATRWSKHQPLLSSTTPNSGLVSTTMANNEDQRTSLPPVLTSPSATGFPMSNGSANLAPMSSPSRSSAPRNEHPYAFKSTSSGILTRSNSIGNNSRHTHHSYTPATPHTPGLSRSQSIGHRHTRSLNNVAPPTPLPMPPSPSTPARVDSVDAISPAPYRVKRRETLPSLSSPTQITKEITISDLPVSALSL
jgi:hypothetical protein